jgi:phage terminase large subunit GpA-like protein
MDRKRWVNWRKVHPIKGATSPKAEQLPPKATPISKDNEGRAIEPTVGLWVLGVHKLKEQVLEDLAIEDDAPGQVYFPGDMPEKAYEELFNEVLIDGKWVRNGPNETLDLMGYSEAARLMLQPDREGISWGDPAKRPIWARPVSLQPEGGDPEDSGGGAPKEPVTKPQSLLDRFDRLNQR